MNIINVNFLKVITLVKDHKIKINNKKIILKQGNMVEVNELEAK